MSRLISFSGFIVVIAALLGFVPPALSGAEPSIRSDQKASTQSKPAETSTLRKRVRGALSARGVGRLKIGSSPKRAIGIFGKPKWQQVNDGCPLYQDDVKNRTLAYRLDGRSLRLYFDVPGGFASFTTNSPRLRTDRGVRVTSSFKKVRRKYGRKLSPLNLGSFVSTPRDGTYVYRKNSKRSLWFNVKGHRVKRISGGILKICE